MSKPLDEMDLGVQRLAVICPIEDQNVEDSGQEVVAEEFVGKSSQGADEGQQKEIEDN